MELIPLGPDFGVEVRGVNLIDVASSDRAYREVRAAFEAHSILLFRNQEISDDVQVAYSRAFGPLELGKVASLGVGTFFARITNIGPDGKPVPATDKLALRARANQLWHTDSSFHKTPALASVLSARTLSAEGGETQFTSTRRAWSRLASERQRQLKDLIVTHSYANSRDQIDPNLMGPEERAAMPPVRWRMTWRNPANDERALYVASHAGAIDGMGNNEGKALLGELIEGATKAEFTYLHRWRPGDVVMWDNRATMHRGRPWPIDQKRLLVRTTISATDADGLAELRPAA
jgi:alpha-ketoglutarate-dependent 2,4-dichlorophenoxyacetate dioxygenase